MWAMLARGGRSLLVTILIAVTWIVLPAEESYACDCAEPRHAFAEADSAFVGTLIELTEGRAVDPVLRRQGRHVSLPSL